MYSRTADKRDDAGKNLHRLTFQHAQIIKRLTRFHGRRRAVRARPSAVDRDVFTKHLRRAVCLYSAESTFPIIRAYNYHLTDQSAKRALFYANTANKSELTRK